MGELKKVIDDSYSTNNDKSFKYPWCGSDTRDVFDAYLIESELTVEMPSLEIVTPFGKIPTNMLYDKTYVVENKGRLVWRPFQHYDICTHVPYASSDAESIKYEHKQYNNQKSTTPDVKYTTYFIAEKLKLFEAVDSTKEVEMSVRYNCITRPANSVLFTTNSESLLKFEDIPVAPFLIKYPQASFKHLLISPDRSIASVGLTNSHPSKINTNLNLVQNIKPTIDTGERLAVAINATQYYTSPNIDRNAKTHDIMFAQAVKSINTTGTATGAQVADYNNYLNEQTQKKNIAKLAHEMCVSSQREYDDMSRTLVVNPTRLIVQKTKKPIQAKYAGTNFFSVRTCSDVTIVSVIPTLFTNSSVAVKVNGVLTRVNDLVSNLSVSPSNLTCLAGVLVVFKVGSPDKTAQSTELVGQVDVEGIIHTDKAQLIEPCSRNSLGANHKIFLFKKKAYVFTNYILEYQVSDELFYQTKHPLHQKSQDTLKQNGTVAPKYADLEEILNKIRFLEVTPPPVLDGFQFAPFALFSSAMYTVAEIQSLPISISDLVMRQVYERYFDQAVEERLVSDYTDNSTSSVDAGNLFSALGNGVSEVLKGGASALATVIHEGGSVLHTTLNDGANVFSSVGHTLSSTLTSLVMPIAVIGGLVLVGGVVAYVIYRKYMAGGNDSKKKKNKKKRKNSTDSTSSSEEEEDDEEEDTTMESSDSEQETEKRRLV
ncbi:hypothetical protein DPMN_112118 [Dreissena polymorpha]|uniref:Uncharacterized protein n=1 Tax=Dreissena polymorpha TaxID=45954 RepID=A0A9D4KFQ0_DREPO|nr:hypothetical protein DPMN_112118 [Dreissena polymorpha]